jgi:hypothetical protein
VAPAHGDLELDVLEGFRVHRRIEWSFRLGRIRAEVASDAKRMRGGCADYAAPTNSRAPRRRVEALASPYEGREDEPDAVAESRSALEPMLSEAFVGRLFCSS